MSNKVQVPKLRFKGFEDEWEEVQLSDISKISTGKSKYRKEITNQKNNPYPVLGSRGIVSFDKNYDYEGKFLLTARVGINAGMLYQYDGKCKITDNTIFIQNKNLSFLKNSLDFKNIRRLSFGTGQPLIKSSELSKFKIPIPNEDEQQKIGEFFAKLDRLIEAHSRKMNLLENFKKSMFQQLTTFNNSSNPKISFLNPKGEWIEYKISDIFKVTRGHVLSIKSISKNKDNSHKYPVYSSQTKNNGLLGYYSEYMFENAITWTTDGANAGTTKFRPGKFYSTNVNGVLLSNEGYANNIVAELINFIAPKYVSRVGNPKLMNNVMSEIKIKLPSLFEQQKISQFLQKIDQEVYLREQKINQLKQLKKAYLQKMFC